MDAVQQFRVKETKRATRRLYAEVCRNYPQYRLDEVVAMPIGDLNLLAAFARLQRVEDLRGLYNVVVAPHSKDPDKVRKALDEQIKQLTNLL